QIAGVDDQEHRGGEEGDQGGVGGVARVVAQVTDGVQLHATGDQADEDGDQDGEAIEVQGEGDGHRSGGGEPVGGVGRRATALPYGDERGEREGGGRRQHGQRLYEARGAPAQQEGRGGSEEGQQRDEGGQGRQVHAAASAFSPASTRSACVPDGR